MDSNHPFRKAGFFGLPHDRRGYHHGRLKDALLEAARILMSERGGGGFTLSEAARRVGVTAAATYRHFADRNALMSELALRGFELFGQRMAGAWDQGRPEPVAALLRMASAYLAFAYEEPGLYAAMFNDVSALQAAPQAGAAADRAFEQLLRATQAALAVKQGAPDAAPLLALQIWVLCHGAARLVAGGHLPKGMVECDPEMVLTMGIAGLLEQSALPGAPAGGRRPRTV